MYIGMRKYIKVQTQRGVGSRPGGFQAGEPVGDTITPPPPDTSPT